jgi:hypothetical protein
MSAKQEAFRIFMSMRTEICLLHDSELLKDKIAKRCALIAVDEMLDFRNALYINEGSLAHQWLLAIKQEIENYEV